jgi:hypothetical protein
MMEAERTVGRRLGVLLLAHLPLGLMAPYILILPAIAPPGFLENAAAVAPQMRAAVLLMFIGSMLALGASIVAYAAVGRYSRTWALWLVALAAVNFALQAVDSGAILAMLTVSQQSAEAGGADAALYQAAAVAVGSARKWAHYAHLFVVGSWLFTLHATLLRFALVPRALAAVGLVATVSQFVGVTLLAILGSRIITPMAMPLAATYLTLGLWLTIKGFPPQRPPLDDVPESERRPPRRASPHAAL